MNLKQIQAGIQRAFYAEKPIHPVRTHTTTSVNGVMKGSA